MIEISASILSVKKENAIKTFYNLEYAKIDYFHIDVMDGNFVENDTTTIMNEYTSIIKNISSLPLDVHLMVKNVKQYIYDYLAFNPNIITVHFESFDSKESLLEAIKIIKENNVKVGISIKPETSIEEIYEFLPLVHLVLIMTVEPGKGGQKLIDKTIFKIEELKQYINQNNFNIDIEVDGGINLENIIKIKEAGANIATIGNNLISTDNYTETVKKFKDFC